MTVTHNGKQYTAKKLNDNEWQLTSVSAPREKLVLNRWQMHIAGLLKQVEVNVGSTITAPPHSFANASRPA
ncbi:hypothetical protein V6D92_07750 [Enterobacter hormaechei]